jgi:hypothetical protein
MAGVVMAIAVQLDGEVPSGPAAVNPAAAGEAICLRQGQPRIAEALEEAGLQPAQGDRDVAAENAPEGAGASACRPPGQHRFHLLRRCAVKDLSFMAGAGQPWLGQTGSKINERSGNRGNRDSAATQRVLGVDSARAVDGDSRNAPLSGSEDLWWRRRSLDQTPHVRRCAAAQQGLRPTCLHGGEVTSLDAGREVPNPVDPAVDR